MDWPQALKEYRRRHTLTQAALAEILNVDPTTVSRWERGRDEPALGIQRRLRSLVIPATSGVSPLAVFEGAAFTPFDGLC